MNRHLASWPKAAVLIVSTAATAVAAAGLATGQQAGLIGTLEGHTEPVYAVAWAPDSLSLVSVGFDNTVRLWDPAAKKELHKFEGHTSLVLTVAPSPDGKQLLTGSLDKTARIWARPVAAPTKELGGQPAGVQCGRWGP